MSLYLTEIVLFTTLLIHECHEMRKKTDTRLFGVLRPDRIKWTGIPEMFFSLLLHKRGRTDMSDCLLSIAMKYSSESFLFRHHRWKGQRFCLTNYKELHRCIIGEITYNSIILSKELYDYTRTCRPTIRSELANQMAQGKIN